MRVIIAGSRSFSLHPEARLILQEALSSCPFFHEISHVISGGARGIDTLAVEWARHRAGLDASSIPYTVIRPDWNPGGRFDRTAGFARNHVMAAQADALIAVWDGKSKGTLDMIAVMRDLDKPVHIHTRLHSYHER